MSAASAELFERLAAELSPEGIKWQDIGSDGTRYALLHGLRDVAGVEFVYAFFLPAGFWDAPHFHSADARVAVLSGVLHLGYGDTLDLGKASRYAAGTELLVPAGAMHFDGSDTDTLILGTAAGPWATTYLDPSHRASAGTPE